MEEGISIIVPIYNTDTRLLKECIKSIIEQTYEKIEILLINDGSTQTQVEVLLDEYKKRDTRINVIHKHNSGVSSTRNFRNRYF